MGTVLALPTAAPERVRQRPLYALPVKARRALLDGGTVANHPTPYQSPEERREAAYKARLREVYDAGDLTRSPSLFVALAILQSLPKEQRRTALETATGLHRITPSDSSRAAVAILRVLVEGKDTELFLAVDAELTRGEQ